MSVAGLVLAAGAGRRYGMPKALVAYQGRLLVQRAADTLREAGCDRVLIVLGAAAERVRALVLPDTGVGPDWAVPDTVVNPDWAVPDTGVNPDWALPDTVVNPDWATGMGSSLRIGLTTLAGTDAIAAVVLLVDMPGVTAEAVRRIIAHATEDALVMGGYGDRRGHPVLLGRDHWDGVAASATGDRGARDYLRTHEVLVVPVGDVADDEDLDEPGNFPSNLPSNLSVPNDH
ncbi:nucleotidyltransferase family protein [Actinoplanes sp. NPDC023936]|uniref:nucleotidyltransferase family protein n=1 Tax=Actinoplanes sp. NPDC023936 TaxID=3154910 RepID=UPI0033C4CE6C